jgi:hypothetical protein
MERHMQNVSGDNHAIDVLGTALMRATGVLSALTACQDPAKGNFALSGPFVVQAITALEGFVNDARNAFFDLCGAAEHGNSKPQARSSGVAASLPPLAEPADPSVFMTGDQSGAVGVLPDFYEIRRRENEQALAAHNADYQGTDEIALTYESLLRKLTAAEVFAVEQGMGDDDRSNPLLPLLKSLRSDLERIRAA